MPDKKNIAHTRLCGGLAASLRSIALKSEASDCQFRRRANPTGQAHRPAAPRFDAILGLSQPLREQIPSPGE
jgi:hypothetical protein